MKKNKNKRKSKITTAKLPSKEDFRQLKEQDPRALQNHVLINYLKIKRPLTQSEEDLLAAAKIQKISKEIDEGKRKTIPLDEVLKELGIKRKDLK